MEIKEEHKEINEKTKKELKEARKNIKAGKVVSHEEVMKLILKRKNS